MFLHISCANEPPYPVSNTLEMESENANFLLFNGDTVYADAFWLEIENQANLFDPQDGQNLDYYRSLYRLQRNGSYTGAGFHEAILNTAIIANWDDHEVIDNYSGRNNTELCNRHDDFSGADIPIGILCELGYQAFHEYTPLFPDLDQEVAGVNPETRVFRNFRAGIVVILESMS